MQHDFFSDSELLLCYLLLLGVSIRGPARRGGAREPCQTGGSLAKHKKKKNFCIGHAALNKHTSDWRLPKAQVGIKVLSKSDATSPQQRHFLTGGCIMLAHENLFPWAVTGETEPGGLRLIRSTATLSGVSSVPQFVTKSRKKKEWKKVSLPIRGRGGEPRLSLPFVCGGGMNCKKWLPLQTCRGS